MNFILPIRGVQLLFAVILLGLSGYLVSVGYGSIDGYSYSVGEFGFGLFTSIWTLLVLAFLIPATLGKFVPEKIRAPVPVLAVDALTTLFWFASWIAMAAWRGQFGSGRYDSGFAPFSTSAAFAAFGAFEWILFTATTVLGAMGLRGSKTAATTPAPTTTTNSGVVA